MPQHVYKFKKKDYIGELNLNALERRIIVRELKKTQQIKGAIILLNFSERGLSRKIEAHQITKDEWKIQTLKKN